MVTFDDPVADARAAAEALRGLAHASHAIDQPGDSYTVLAALSGALASLRQTLEQLAAHHDREAGHAAVEGDRGAGRDEALRAAAELRGAAGLTGQAASCLDAAWIRNGRVAWHTEQPQPPVSGRPQLPAPPVVVQDAPRPPRDLGGLGR